MTRRRRAATVTVRSTAQILPTPLGAAPAGRRTAPRRPWPKRPMSRDCPWTWPERTRPTSNKSVTICPQVGLPYGPRHRRENGLFRGAAGEDFGETRGVDVPARDDADDAARSRSPRERGCHRKRACALGDDADTLGEQPHGGGGPVDRGHAPAPGGR